MAPFFLASAEQGHHHQQTSCHWMSLSPTLQVRPLSQRGTIRTWHRPLLHSQIEPSAWPGFATPLTEKILR